MYLLLLIYKIPPTVLYLLLFLLLLIYKIPPTLHLHVSFIYYIFMVTKEDERKTSIKCCVINLQAASYINAG
jgi:hypothetical protein